MIKMMIIVVMVFTICWLPINVFIIMGDLNQTIYEYEHIIYVWFLVHWLSMSHTCCNPIIYCWMNDKFRDGFRLFASRCTCCPIFKSKFNNRNKIISRFGTNVSNRTSTSSTNSSIYNPTPPTTRPLTDYKYSSKTRCAESIKSNGSLKMKQMMKQFRKPYEEAVLETSLDTHLPINS
jgi:hypothetical protein